MFSIYVAIHEIRHTDHDQPEKHGISSNLDGSITAQLIERGQGSRRGTMRSSGDAQRVAGEELGPAVIHRCST